MIEQLKYNQAGYGRALNENQLYELLKEHIYTLYLKVKEQYEFDRGCIIDFFGNEQYTNKPILIEVKNWFVSIKDMEQILKYFIHATEMYGENKFSLIVYAGGCENDRKKILEKLGIEIYLTKDVLK